MSEIRFRTCLTRSVSFSIQSSVLGPALSLSGPFSRPKPAYRAQEAVTDTPAKRRTKTNQDSLCLVVMVGGL